MNGFWSPNLYYGFSNTFQYEDEKVILDKYTIVEIDRIRTVYNWLQYFSPETIMAEFLSCGLKVTDIYSDVAGKPFVLSQLNSRLSLSTYDKRTAIGIGISLTVTPSHTTQQTGHVLRGSADQAERCPGRKKPS